MQEWLVETMADHSEVPFTFIQSKYDSVQTACKYGTPRQPYSTAHHHASVHLGAPLTTPMPPPLPKVYAAIATTFLKLPIYLS